MNGQDLFEMIMRSIISHRRLGYEPRKIHMTTPVEETLRAAAVKMMPPGDAPGDLTHFAGLPVVVDDSVLLYEVRG